MNTNHPLPKRQYFLTQKQIADRMGISRSRVFQIEQRALRKIRKALQSKLSD